MAHLRTHQSLSENCSIARPQRAVDLKSDYYVDNSSPEGSLVTRFTASGLRCRSSRSSAPSQGGGAATSCGPVARSAAKPGTSASGPPRPPLSLERRRGYEPVVEQGPGTLGCNTGRGPDAEPALPERPAPRIPRARSGRGSYCGCAAARPRQWAVV